MNRRLPAEWEDQDGVLLAWPHAGTDWAPYLTQVEPVFAEIARQIARRERLIIIAPEPERVRDLLSAAQVNENAVRYFALPNNDTWARDFGPLTVLENGRALLLDFGFNGWGLKFACNFDNMISRRLRDAGAFGATAMKTEGMIFEGGSIESDGSGTLLTTADCLLEANRNPHLSRAQIEERMKRLLGARRVLWLENGYLAGDDTDSHIDTLARFAPNDTIIYSACDDPKDEHFAALQSMAAELEGMRTANDQPYTLIPLPWPRPCYDEKNQRLPATYANFLVINGAVLVPVYGDPRDEAALLAIERAFPGREVVGIDCRPLILQHGSLHCVTMQLPKGVLP